jgi:hypothetical protein
MIRGKANVSGKKKDCDGREQTWLLDKQKELLGFLGCQYKGARSGKGKECVQEHLRELEGQLSQMAQQWRLMETEREDFVHSKLLLSLLPPSPG